MSRVQMLHVFPNLYLGLESQVDFADDPHTDLLMILLAWGHLPNAVNTKHLINCLHSSWIHTSMTLSLRKAQIH